MQQTCKHCSAPFEISDTDLRFYDDVSPEFGGKKYAIPPPTFCPDCRYQRRLTFRNENVLYERKSALSGKSIISIYAPDSPYTVYDQGEWWSDDWNPCDYGRDFDFSRPFTEQFVELNQQVPHASLFTTNVENSYYTNYAINLRNCYLVFGVTNGEDNLYGHYVVNCTDTVDALSAFSCEHCYEGVTSKGCYHCLFFRYCRNCSNCFMIENCINCKDCIECYGLRNQEYCYQNQPVGREEIERLRRELYPLTQERIRAVNERLHALARRLPHPHAYIIASENCTGDTIFNSKNCERCFDIDECEDCKELCRSPRSQHCHDSTFNAPDGNQWCYELCSAVGDHTCMTNFLSWYNSNVYYSYECHNSQYLFGCASMNKRKYCILNRQYSQEEYETLVPKIIEHMRKTREWGEYFPTTASPFAYNETIAVEDFPMQEEEVRKRGWRWRPQHDDVSGVTRIIPAQKLPETIDAIPDDILNWAIKCEATGRPFRIVKQELEFYRKMQLPIPHFHPDERHRRRIGLRNPRKLWQRKCGKCGKEIQTTYEPSRPEIVYCETCYLKEVY